MGAAPGTTTSADFRHLLVPFAAAYSAAQSRASTRGYGPDEVKRFMLHASDPAVTTKPEPGGLCKASRKLGILVGGSLPRGYPILASRLGLDWDPTEAAMGSVDF